MKPGGIMEFLYFGEIAIVCYDIRYDATIAGFGDDRFHVGNRKAISPFCLDGGFWNLIQFKKLQEFGELTPLDEWLESHGSGTDSRP